MIEAIECQNYGAERLNAPGHRERKREMLEKRLNAHRLLSAIKSAEACLRLFEAEGEFHITAPGYVDGEEYAHNVRIAHIHAARQAREVLAEALNDGI